MKRLQQACYERLKASLDCVGLVVRGMCLCALPDRDALERAQRENKQLVKRLASLRADYNQLRKETDELLRYADRELSALKATNAGLAEAFDELQLRVWELEQQVDELLLYIASLTVPSQEAVAFEVGEGGDELAGIYLGIVGGQDATRQEVIRALSEQHGLQRWVEIPALQESNIHKRVLREKIERCDLIVIVTAYMSHSLTKAVYGLKAAGALSGEVVLLNFRGKSGIVREILKLSAQMKRDC
ncbi:MAG: hypothetical protein WA885_13785 [Phormidesmis sp.]